jgi:SAM-dependent methyltransferase
MHSLIITYNKISICGKVLFITCILFLVVLYFKGFNTLHTSIENFENDEQFQFKSNTIDIYDEFYADIYDQLVFNKLKNDFEIIQIKKLIDPTTKNKILDIGCGTGHHVAKLSHLENTEIIGIDQSSSMIKKAKENYPTLNFKVQDIVDKNSFLINSFTHILALYFTIYYFDRKDLFFGQCFDWLMPGGFIILHLVDKKEFDPMVPSGNPLYVVSPQKYAKERITRTTVNFNNFKYQSNFTTDKEENVSIFEEKFSFANGKSRKNEHQLFMEDKDVTLQIATSIGFIVRGKANLIKCGYESQYLYILMKPE